MPFLLEVTSNKPPDSLTDDNECESGTDECPTDATCKNMVPGYTCVCGAGFAFDKRSNSCRGKNFKVFTLLKACHYNSVIIFAKKATRFQTRWNAKLIIALFQFLTIYYHTVVV